MYLKKDFIYKSVFFFFFLALVHGSYIIQYSIPIFCTQHNFFLLICNSNFFLFLVVLYFLSRRVRNFLSQLIQFGIEKGFESFRWFHDRTTGLVEKAAIFKNAHYISNKFTKFVVASIIHFLVNITKVWKVFFKKSQNHYTLRKTFGRKWLFTLF